MSDLLARLEGLGAWEAVGEEEAAAIPETDGDFHPRSFLYLERYVSAYCTALDDLRQWVDQSDSFRGTDVSRHVQTAGICAAGSRRFLGDTVSYPRNWSVRAIMSEVGAAYQAMTRNDETCLQKMHACATALEAYMDYAYPDHDVLPFAGSYK